MLPISFAPMILKWVLPEVRELLVPLFKYKDEPNDADRKLIVHEKELKLLREMVIDLGKDSHPEKPFEDRITALEKKLA